MMKTAGFPREKREKIARTYESEQLMDELPAAQCLTQSYDETIKSAETPCYDAESVCEIMR